MVADPETDPTQAISAVDVVIPAFNAERYIEQTVRSVVAQTVPPDCIIVVNDGSTDATGAILRALQDELGERKLRIITQPNGGLSAARNAGIQASDAEFLALLDADDLWLPGKLAAQLKVANGVLAPGVVYCDYAQIDENGAPLPLAHFALDPRVRGSVLQVLNDRNCIAGSASAVLIRRALFDAVGGFDVSLRSAEDWDMWIRLAAVTPFDFVAQPLVLIRRHTQSMQANPRKMLEGELVLHDKLRSKGLGSAAHLKRLQRLAALNSIDISSLDCARGLSAVTLAAFSGWRYRLWASGFRTYIASRLRVRNLLIGDRA